MVTPGDYRSVITMLQNDEKASGGGNLQTFPPHMPALCLKQCA